jgi:hypothetical protein
MLCCLMLLLGACQPRTPDDLALTVLLEEIGQLDGVVMGFIPCISIDSADADASALITLRKRYPEVVRGSECQYAMDGAFHKTSHRKAILVNVFGYKRSGEIELEARHAGKFGTSKTLQVRREPSGWKIVRTLRFEMARLGRPEPDRLACASLFAAIGEARPPR